jgi:endonuclease/exonuclease/phosphatase family metal-dependent hydrolase
VIRSVEPDLVALQEVDSNVRRTKLLDEPTELARLTGMQFVFGPNIPYEGGLYGNAVLSRWPIVKSTNHRLPTFYAGEQRGVLEVSVQPPNWDQPILVFATHFDYRRGSPERLPSARMINALIAARGDVPALLVGDLNDTPGGSTLRELENQWRQANRHMAVTYPAYGPHKQIDYVMLHPRRYWRVIETRVIDERFASDHRPLLAVLEL